MKKILFVLNRPPFSGIDLQESLDVILTTAVFDQSVTLLLLDQAVLALKAGQDSAGLGLKETSAMFKVLEVYQVEQVYVETESLQQYALKAEDLIVPVKQIERQAVKHLMAENDIILSL